jgi:hypothetical protein
MWEMINARLQALDSWHAFWSHLDGDAAERRRMAEELAPECCKLVFGEADAHGTHEVMVRVLEEWNAGWVRAQLQKVEAQRSELVQSLHSHTKRAEPPRRIIEKHLGFVLGDGPLRHANGEPVHELADVAPLEVTWRMMQADPDFQQSLTLCRQEVLKTAFEAAVASVALYIESSAAELDDLAPLRERVIHDLRWACLLEHPAQKCPADLELRFDNALRDPEILGVLNGDFSRNSDGYRTASGPRRAALAVAAKVVGVGDATVGRRLARGRSDSRSGKVRVRGDAG